MISDMNVVTSDSLHFAEQWILEFEKAPYDMQKVVIHSLL